MNKKQVIIAAAIGALIGAAYYTKIRAIPVVGTVATKLPGADV